MGWRGIGILLPMHEEHGRHDVCGGPHRTDVVNTKITLPLGQRKGALDQAR
jgi:hypothetical protein